jgi:glycosyltransferase involved in cell wall biosynthesis
MNNSIINEKQQPLFSVLVANYNNGKYLTEAIESVLSQNYPCWEIILIDDDSTDDSVAIAESLVERDSRIRFFKNTANQGCAGTLARCIEHAGGELLAILDPDDVLASPDTLAIMAKAHITHPECSLIYSSMYVCDEFLNKIRIHAESSEIRTGDFLISRDAVVSHLATFTRTAYDRTSGINPEVRKSVDHELYFKLEEVGSLKYIDIPLYNYRINPHSMSIGTREKEISAYHWHCRVSIDAIRRRMKANAALYQRNKQVYHRDLLYYRLWVARKESYKSLIIALIPCICEYLKRETPDRFFSREIRKFLFSWKEKDMLKIGFKDKSISF